MNAIDKLLHHLDEAERSARLLSVGGDWTAQARINAALESLREECLEVARCNGLRPSVNRPRPSRVSSP